MEIKSFNNNDLWFEFSDVDLWFEFSDEEMDWNYVLIGDWIYGGIWVDSEYVLYEKDLKEIEWR